MSVVPPGAAGARSRRARLGILVLFAAAMGWLEGVVVVYIRGLFGMAHGAVTPPPGEVLQRFARLPWLLPTEQSREVATLVMLGAVAWLAADRWRPRLGALLTIFGVWDIVYYIALYLMLRWPPSLTTMDVLFLIPLGPWWNQPVWVPVVVSIVFIVVGVNLYGERKPDRAG